MKKHFLFVFCFLPLFLHAQMNVKNGYVLPVKGTLRVLVVYAEVDYSSCSPAEIEPHIETDWPVGQLPTWKGDLFDANLITGQTPTPGTITDFYYQHSYGNFEVLGDYYPHIVSVPCLVANAAGDAGGFSPIRSYFNSLTIPITSSTGLTLSDFDSYDLYTSAGGLLFCCKQKTTCILVSHTQG